MRFGGTKLKRGLAVGLIVYAMAIIATAAAALVAPAIAPRGALFTTNAVVTLGAPAGQIRFTLDGTEPTTNSPIYTAPLVLSNSTIVKARAFTNSEESEISAEAFTWADTNVLSFTSSLPVIVLQTYGGAIPSPSNAPAWMQIINVSSNQPATLTNAPEFSAHASLKPRGFSSRRYPKRSLTVELRDATGEEDRKAPLLGMPADADWVLYAPYIDRSLMRDVLAYELSNQIGRYASRTRYVEVFLNDSTNKLASAHYVGVYVLEEKVKVAPQRVAIHKMSPKDDAEPAISGGYLFKKDHMEKAGADPAETPPRSRPPALMGRFPSEPGGFPALITGFLQPQDPPIFQNALSVVTNTVAITNVVSGSNVLVAPPSVTIVRNSSQILTNQLTVTNVVVSTNQIVTTNFPLSTNISISSHSVVVTNPVVVAQSMAATNVIGTTNQVDANTTVVNTTVTLLTSTTYRTNFVPITNVVSVTNTIVVTNSIVATNVVIVTNVAVSTLPYLTTNNFLTTNIFTIGKPDPLPGSTRLIQSGDGFLTSQLNPFFFVEPKASKITPAQRTWLTNYLNNFEAALYGPAFRDPNAGYRAFLDVDSFIDHHLFVEATKNIDGFRFSTYFTKDRGGKLKIEPIWDWNLSMGLAKGKQGNVETNWYWPQLSDQQYSWYRRLFEDPDFGQRYIDRWAQWRTNVFATSNLWKRVDQLAAQLEEPAARNFARWPILGDPIGSEYFVGKTFAEEVQYLKTWMSNRLAWMDRQFVPPPIMSSLTNAPAAPLVKFRAPMGEVYVTTDGTDPRGPGGQVSRAARGAQSVVVSNAVKAIARTRSPNGWSSPVSAKLAD